MKITLYGTRGSTPVCGAEYTRYGGNTTCVTIETKEGLFIIDCGTGLQSVQKKLFHTGKYEKANIFISHLHWDHIQGAAFFAPFFSKDYKFVIYGEERYGKSLQEQLNGILESPMFPVKPDAFLADMQYSDITCSQRFEVNGMMVDTIRLDHPDICTGYRFTCGDKKICMIGDCEQHREEIEEFAKGADVVIFDAQYTDSEYISKRGWGHSTWQQGCGFAQKCRVGQLILTHHDPFRTDEQLDIIQEKAAEYYGKALVAFDGMCITLD